MGCLADKIRLYALAALLIIDKRVCPSDSSVGANVGQKSLRRAERQPVVES